jgi:hypothetical protein
MKKPDIRISTGTIKDLVVVALLVIVSWKLISADFTFTFENIKTSDLLSVFLALFAIGLSVSFYIKANEVSNMFYDNMYKFTKDNSELLGRMEAGFSEQLRHLDQGYTGLKDKFDKLPIDLGETREKVADEKAEVKKLKLEKNELLNELASRANLQEEEKEQLFTRLSESEFRLNKADREMRRLQHKIRDADDEDSTIDGVAVRAIRYTQRQLIGMLDIDDLNTATDDEIFSSWNLIKDELPRVYIKDLWKGGVVNKDFQLTAKGADLFRGIANENV